jgi:hypothetical protein
MYENLSYKNTNFFLKPFIFNKNSEAGEKFFGK